MIQEATNEIASNKQKSFENFAIFCSQCVDLFGDIEYIVQTRRGVEQLAARRAHNPEAAGSSPAPAILTFSVF